MHDFPFSGVGWAGGVVGRVGALGPCQCKSDNALHFLPTRITGIRIIICTVYLIFIQIMHNLHFTRETSEETIEASSVSGVAPLSSCEFTDDSLTIQSNNKYMGLSGIER